MEGKEWVISIARWNLKARGGKAFDVRESESKSVEISSVSAERQELMGAPLSLQA